MAENEHSHIFLNDLKSSIPFSPPSGGGLPNIPQRDRNTHSEYLIRRFSTIWKDLADHKQERIAASIQTKDGFYIQFKGKPGCDLVTKSLENIKKGIRLLNIKEVEQTEGKEIFATVYIPDGQTDFFIKKVRDYANPANDTEIGNFKNQLLINSIEDVVIASQLESFWQDSNDLIPNETAIWCEVWLLYSEASNKREVITNFFKICKDINLEYKKESLHFPERLIVLVKANKDNLMELIERSDNIAEFRKAQETASFWTSQTNIEQLEWVRDLISRLKISETTIVVSILDSGVNNGHLLLQPLLADKDCHSYNPGWGVNDNDEHGTLISGIALFDNLQEKLEITLPIELKHKLESIKILPPKHFEENPYELWGEITAQAISKAEISNPDYRRILCMAITSAQGTDKGRPSSWSAAIDSLTSGADDGVKRLFIISAGNMTNEDWKFYPESNKERAVQSPAQSWNALTVGAYTRKIHINEKKYKGYKTLSKADSLSPFSTTSISWESNKWSIKPDVVMEGGNLAVAPDGFISNLEDLSSLTVSANITKNQFDIINGTSEATAHASWFAAQLQTRYPDAWPETIRGLIVHSAEWTKGLINQFNIDLNKKGSISDLLKICGFGVPNLRKAMDSIGNSLTLIAQEEIQPFCKRGKGGGYKSNEMHLYKLPWPKQELLDLGEIIVKLRITLSYFIEPGPGEIGWKDRYRYASHALRFELNNPSESSEDFTQRINLAIERDEDFQPVKNDSDRWTIGSDFRHHGSIHSDFIERTAAEIASCNLIGIYPVIGWWRERTNLKLMEKKSRYSLIISLHTEEVGTDLYTPIINLIKTPLLIKI